MPPSARFRVIQHPLHQGLKKIWNLLVWVVFKNCISRRILFLKSQHQVRSWFHIFFRPWWRGRCVAPETRWGFHILHVWNETLLRTLIIPGGASISRSKHCIGFLRFLGQFLGVGKQPSYHPDAPWGHYQYSYKKKCIAVTKTGHRWVDIWMQVLWKRKFVRFS